jgi:polyhydroxyalkanoate synthase
MTTQNNPTSFTADIESAMQKYRTGMDIIFEGAKATTGRTPKEVVWSKNKAKLYRYEPAKEKRYPVPILFIYALINRSYVLDLMPNNSLIEYLVNQGFDVYMLDWGTPGDEDQSLTFENYILDYIPRAVKKVLRTSHAEELTIFGFCMGGTMSAMYASLFPGKPLRNLILLTAPIDFTEEVTGLYGLWTSERNFDPDLIVEAFGNVPGELVDTGNRLVKPVTNYVGTYVTMWDRVLHDKPMDTWLAMNKWVNDGVPFAGETFKQWIREFYQQNKLVKGEITLRGRRVDLHNITCPVLNIAGKKDHICTLPQAEATMGLIGSEDKEFYVLDAGHVGLLTGSEAKRNLWPKIRSWLELRSR